MLSDANRALLEVIRTAKPESISELADLTGRKQGNLSRTLKTMSRYGQTPAAEPAFASGLLADSGTGQLESLLRQKEDERLEHERGVWRAAASARKSVPHDSQNDQSSDAGIIAKALLARWRRKSGPA